MRRLFPLFLLFLAPGPRAAAAPPAPRLVSLAFEPPEAALDRGAPRQLLVTGVYADGSRRDLTGLARFRSLRPDLAGVEAGGRAVPRKDGRAPVAAWVGSLKANGALVVRRAKRAREPGFAASVAPILTYSGCNSGSCHGAPGGKGGFRLSLFNRSAEEDYRAVAREGDARRIVPREPASSLLLRKPSMQLAHRGGLRFRPGSREYRMLEEWIRAGAPEGSGGAPESLEVLPRGRVLPRPGERQRLVVLARFPDGSVEDVTSLSVFTSGDEGVAGVDAAGRVTAAAVGEAPIMARFAGRIAVATVGVSASAPGTPADLPEAAGDNPVDRYLTARLRALRIPAAGDCSDETFLRRVSLDLTATLPTAGETRAFLADTRPDRRARLVETLLARPEYADTQALHWADRLRSNSRFHRVGGVRAYQKWLRESFLANMPLDEFARRLLTARGQNYSDGPSNYWGNYDVISRPDEIAPQTSQLFLGVRLHCAQCHNHPFERWTQEDFYSLAAVFAQVKGRATKQTQEFELYLDPAETVRHPDTKQVMPPRALDSPVFTAAAGEDVRDRFAAWLTSPENPYFARAMVNRIWRQLMGRGLVEPVDDFRVTNPASHPELLDFLARELAARRFDQKAVIRLIVNSRAYQRDYTAVPVNERDTKFYSRAYARRLPAEVYFDAVCQVTGKPEEFRNWPEAKRAIQLPENRYSSYFLDTFGRPNRLVICEREEEGTLSQALNLIHGREIHDRVCAPDGTLARLLASGRDDDSVTEELFLSALQRFPRPEERERLRRQRSRAATREEGFQDLLWALLSSREFQFNH